ncbi:MAG: Clp1/GlmU family protein [Candidatus Bathyarchaeia archaeon]
MRLNLKRGKTLLVDGPASITLTSGSAIVLGAKIKVGSNVVVRKGKRLPFEVMKDAAFELTMGENSTFLEIDGTATPDSWRDAVDEILKLNGPSSILILGGVDSGKTSFCTYLANRALGERWGVRLIDGDLGQSDIGPPATIGLASVTEPIIDPFKVEAESVVFVGTTSPSRALNTCLNALKSLKERYTAKGRDLLIVNTDGWIEGEDAVNYKAQVVDLFSPDVIVVIQEEDELKPVIKRLRDSRIIVVEVPKTIKRRSREVRKALREMAYKKYLKGAKFRSYVLNYIEIRGFTAEADSPVGSEKDEGLLVGLEDREGRFLGIGILSAINHDRRTLKVYTSVREPSPRIVLGEVRLSFGGNEIS